MNQTWDIHASGRMRSFHAFGLVGYPLAHSRSPKIHQAALQALALRGTYQLFPLPHSQTGQAELKRLLAEVRAGEIHGLNITIPHKQTVMRFLDIFTPTAAAIGAVNTVFLEEGRLVGDNTDGPGFWTDLCRSLGSDCVIPGQALILGAGGSARAAAYALLNAGFTITIAARRADQAQEIVAQFPDFEGRIVILDLQSLASLKGEVSLVVNTTPLGMYPLIDDSPWPGDIPFPENAALYDLVYNPVVTKLVQDARERGRCAVNGLGMLVEQAALSFERWTGLTAPRQAMMEAAYG
jgi:shikimate dehydrogenase